MRFFFPDSQDQIDPHFDFVDEEHRVHRVRQRDDRYAHEVLVQQPFDGVLVSKPIVDGHGSGAAGLYSTAARNRLYREGVRRFFRLDACQRPVVTMGDCGAFTYVNEDEPPYTVDEVIDFYDGCEFDIGVAPDHIVFGFVKNPGLVADEREPEWERRRGLTIANAQVFLERHEHRGCSFEPVAVAHGWSAATYADSVALLQAAGYRRIALGGMVPLKTPDIVASLNEINTVLKPDTELHLLGVTRTEEIPTFADLGVTSFDSTSPFRQAFKDDKDNYYTLDGSYVALRVPQIDGNAKVKRLVSSGRLDQATALKLERLCLETLRRFDRGGATVEETVGVLGDLEQLLFGRNEHADAYRRTLEAEPWKSCGCGLCERDGIEVMVFRGSERNKRRGFHNLAVFRQRLDRRLGQARSARMENHHG